MKTLFIDCGMGAAGDMLSASLLELFDDREAAVKDLNSLGLPHIEYSAQTVEKCGIAGTKLHVHIDGHEEGEHTHEHAHEHTHEHAHEHAHEHSHEHHHSHSSLKDIEGIINASNAAAEDKAAAIAVYRLLAQAESTVHNTDMQHIHFHEVGTLDAIADILAFCRLFNKLEIERVVASAVNVGKGTVHCAHGILPVPAPATALLLKDVPIYSGNDVNGELCTPTGAALLKTFVNEFCDMPVMSVQKIGYGMGTKDFKTANCIRAMLGTAEGSTEKIIELSFNVDDMTAEEIAFGTEELLSGGARDVFCAPVNMKKNRLGTLVTVLCMPEKKDGIIRLIFRHFQTLGIREKLCSRYVMERSVDTVETPLGTVRIKNSSGFGEVKSKYEYDDLARLARENNCSLRQIKNMLKNGGEL